MMTTKYTQSKDINGYNGFGLPFSDTVYSATLAATTDTTLTVPNAVGLGKQGYATIPQTLAVFSYQNATTTWVAVNGTAAVPAGATFAATTSEINPPAKLVNGGDIIHFFSAAGTAGVSVAFYSVS
jgi:hypothetical protein